jgi:serine/threonine-protein kinase
VVLRQTPAAGALAGAGGTGTVVGAGGPREVDVPTVTKKREKVARGLIGEAGLEVEVERAFDEQVRRGRVASQEPAPGGTAPLDGTVMLVVSKGPEPRTVPDYSGRDWNFVKDDLTRLGLKPVYTEAYSNSVTKGYVIGTSPAAGATVDRGGNVTVSISLGPELVAVPDVVGLTVEQAVRRLENAGLVVDNVRRYRPGRIVGNQSIDPGTRVERGTAIDLWLRN